MARATASSWRKSSRLRLQPLEQAVDVQVFEALAARASVLGTFTGRRFSLRK